MRRRICGMALVGIMLLTACDRQGIQVAETAGRTESDTVYEKMQEEQKKQQKSSPSPISEKETELSEVIEKLPSDSPVPSMEPDPDPEIAEAIQKLTDKFAGEGRVLIRPSGTEPKVRVMIEGKDQQMIEHDAKELADLIQNVML